MTNLEEIIDTDSIPLCPLCDQPIMDYEETILAVAHQCKFLIHNFCFLDLNEEDGE